MVGCMQARMIQGDLEVVAALKAREKSNYFADSPTDQGL